MDCRGCKKYVNVLIRSAKDATVDDVNNSDGIILGSGVYNGNPEPDMINFADNVLLIGQGHTVQLANKIGGAFCTSGGFVTGAQPVLNSLARIFMTFGSVFVGGGSWETGQGVCGMVTADNPPATWKWADNQPSLQKNATDYGNRLGAIVSFYDDSYNKAMGQPPPTSGVVLKCTDKKKNTHLLILTIFLALLVLLCILLILFRNK